MRSWVENDDGVEVEHQVGEDGAEDAADDLGRRHGRGRRGVEHPEHALDQRHHRVERGRHRLERQDQRDQRGAGDQAVLEQLEADVVRAEPLRRDARADDRHHEERGADQLGDGPAREWGGRHAVTPPSSALRSARASACTR